MICKFFYFFLDEIEGFPYNALHSNSFLPSGNTGAVSTIAPVFLLKVKIVNIVNMGKIVNMG